MGGPGDVLTKRMSAFQNAVSSTAGGVIVITSISSALVQSNPATEWASFAARYQQFRVRRVTLILDPIFPGSGTPVTAVDAHGPILLGDFIGSAVPAAAVNVLADERSRVFNSSQRIVFSADWSRNPNARLWNPTSAALPVANSFSVVYCSQTSTTLAASTTFFGSTILWDVEFRGSQ